jgi:DNA helicase-2/ATP-dependent DNA helicase PcrA
MEAEAPKQWPSELNPEQHACAAFEGSPLLIVAGAGTGKTNTLAHRVAFHIASGIDPSRILLLTFSRRASSEMLRRVESILARSDKRANSLSRVWGGTFHAIATRLLRMHARSVGMSEAFTVLDRADSEDLLNEVRGELQLDQSAVRFPKKATALSIYSRCVNSSEPIEAVLKAHFPWCMSFPDQLKDLFHAYVQRKQREDILDYDDLLLYWHHLMEDEQLSTAVAAQFDAVLVDEYQDTNRLQAQILKRLCPAGRGLTVVGDDAQSIYSFRAATVNNILDFESEFPGATVLKLRQNYRSVQPILDATNAVISLAARRYEKELFSLRTSAQKPRLVTVMDEQQQSDFVIQQILAHHEAGIPLKRQAVLFRTAHHSDALEVELARRNIPFVKYGGLKFLEAAHIKDALSFLRIAENPRDTTSALRSLQLMDGFGPSHARKAIQHLADAAYDLTNWKSFTPPAAASQQWGAFVALVIDLSKPSISLPDQIARVRTFFDPILEKRYDHSDMRRRDIDQLEQISAGFASRQQMLTELTLDPPASTQDLAGAPFREEDYLILSTIHSAKGCEWDCVYVIHAADGNIPSDLATGSADEIEEERRLFYVALTRARDFLDVVFPLKYYHKKRSTSDRHTYAQLTRFLPESLLHYFERVRLERTAEQPTARDSEIRVDVKARVAKMWT